MRIIIMFDLPTITDKDKKVAAKFRRFLLNDGYIMMQFSVYSRICKNSDDYIKHSNRIKINVPSNGDIRMICITESQYNKMIMFFGERKIEENISIDNMVIF